MRIKVLVYITALLLLFIAGCDSADQTEYQRYNESIFDTFDTLVQVVAYTESEDEFRLYADLIHSRLRKLHKLYDIYNSYEGINNIKTINDNAGIKPVRVDQEIIDLILLSREWAERTGGRTNIALGPVLKIWHSYREEALFDPENAELPPMDKLHEAAGYTDLDLVEVDAEAMTVYLPERRMSLDVGAIAKGLAVEIAAREAMEAGMVSGLISAGGNIRLIGKPLDGDLGYFKDMGTYRALYLAGRQKFVIKQKGFQVFPDEVQDYIASHPKVDVVDVVGVKHRIFDEGIFVFIRPKKGENLSVEEIMEHCQGIASYKRPQHIEIWPEDKEFPLTRVAKVDKKELKVKAESIVEELRKQGGWDAG